MSTNQAGYAPVHSKAPRRWDFLAGLMDSLGLQHFVEVGCKEGRTTGHILKSLPAARVTAIDPWMVMPAGPDEDQETYEAWDFAAIEAEFWRNVGEHRDRCTMLRMTSQQAAAQVATADLVFIDALHDHDSVAADIALWLPRVRVGGVLAGHDFNHKWPGVERAVAEAFDLMQVGVGPDSVWFWIKHEEMPG